MHYVPIWQCFDLTTFVNFFSSFVKMSNVEFPLRLMRKQLMSPTKVGLKSINWYMITMTIEKNSLLLLEISLNVVVFMHLSPTRFSWIIIKLSKVAIRLWMNKVRSSSWNIILYLSLAKENKCVGCGLKYFYAGRNTWEK